MKRNKKFFTSILLVLGMIGMIYYGVPKYEEWKESHSGVPDVISSMSSNKSYYLTVVANSSKVEDKEALARELVQMCRKIHFTLSDFQRILMGIPLNLRLQYI